jgi:DHA2 family multidrug resistance protein
MTAKEDLTGRLFATGGLMLAILMQALDSTIANVALPHMMGSLSASQDQVTWILTSYIVAAAIMTPFTGWLALKIGRKPMFLFSIAAFVAASILCGMATNLPEMVFFRLLQGFAGAGMMPLSQAAIYDLWSPKAIPRVMSIWSAMIMVGPILGPTLGGFLTENFSWRWVFYINVPVGALAFAMIYTSLPSNEGGRQRPFDLVGFFALVLFTGGIQLMVDRGPTLDWFDAREIWVEAVIALIGLYVFVAQMATADHPFFPRAVLHDRNFITSTMMLFFISILLFSTNALMPSFMQNLLGYTALQSGETSMYRGFGSICAFLIVPWLARVLRPRPTVSLGVLVSCLGLWSMAHFDLSMTATNIKIAGALQGFGMGLMANPLSVLSYATIGAELRTEAAVFSNVVRTMGSSLGIASLQAVLTEQSATAHARLAENIVQSDPVIRWRSPDLFSGAGGGLEALNAEITRQGSMIAYDTVFAWMALASLLLLPLLLILRPARRVEAVIESEPLEA